ncbi:hypothetical protein ACHAWF_003652 [Thalassiosira exigua]
MTDSLASSSARRLSPPDAVAAARSLWLTATCQSDLDEVERLYRWALSSKAQANDSSVSNKSVGGESDSDEPPRKKSKSGHCGLDREQFTQAGEKLALLLCQSGRCKKARRGLASMGFTCRLASQVLDYPSAGKATINAKKEISTPPCQIIDGFLSRLDLKRLCAVFASPEANYWTDHKYAVEPPSPYFSYVIPLKEIRQEENGKRPFGFIGDLVEKMISCPILCEKFPKLRSHANFVEIWAHNRPHASGHQMVNEDCSVTKIFAPNPLTSFLLSQHFDSDDEGRGGVRNPVISTILYITNNTGTNGHGNVTGGPSLVTNQKLSDVRLATQGWMAHPKYQRLVAFDGRYLHGVVPGKGYETGRRVTLMLAFWESIQIRTGEGPGSARPFPSGENLPEWACQLVAPSDGDKNCHRYDSCSETEPINLSHIYETLDGKPWKRGMGMPSYDQVFQGF